ncbi:MAG TPA: hypothetical protein GXX51_07005 [Firmicutes bacterium]|nr:hypothetical protein [Bacillota bacterium]
MGGFRVAIAQINPIVGDIGYNASKILDALEKARKCRADLVVFPELAVTGYPPEDLLLKPKFIEENERCVRDIAAREHNAIVVLGFAHKQETA